MPTPYIINSKHIYAGSMHKFMGRVVAVTGVFTIDENGQEAVRYSVINVLGEEFKLDYARHDSLIPIAIL